MSGAHSRPYKSFGFGFKALKNFPELIPLAICIGTACVGGIAFIGYSLMTKPDIRVNRLENVAPWEKVKGKEQRKLMVINPDNYKGNAELDKLREEIGSYRY